MRDTVIRERPKDLIPAVIRAEVASALSGYTLSEIRQWFATERFQEPSDLELGQGAMRRTLVAGIDDTIDFGTREECQRYLRVVERVVEQLEDTAAQSQHRWAGDTKKRILRELSRIDIVPDANGRFLLPTRIVAGSTLTAAPTESGIRLAIAALERPEAEPEERVGAAKELVEATVKFALDELKEPYGSRDDVGALAKRVHSRLKLDPVAVAPTTKGAETIVRILGGLSSIPVGLAELRNAGYGTGHGRGRRIAGIKARHAELAARAAIAYATFILETLQDPSAPWH